MYTFMLKAWKTYNHIPTLWFSEVAKDFSIYRESCQSSATYDLWLKAESWSLNSKIEKKIIQQFKI